MLCVAGSLLWLAGVVWAGGFAATVGGFAVGSASVHLAAMSSAQRSGRWFRVALVFMGIFAGTCAKVFFDLSTIEAMDDFLWGVLFAMLIFSLRWMVYGSDV